MPRPLLRVGFDAWADRLADADDPKEQLGAYETRLAFVDETVATRSNWRAAYIERTQASRTATLDLGQTEFV